MSETEKKRPEDAAGWHTYKCPVCGHSDGTELPVGPSRTVECPHCETRLEITALSVFQQKASARVVKGPGS